MALSYRTAYRMALRTIQTAGFTTRNSLGNRFLSQTPRSLPQDRHHPSPFDRKVLVWTKMFATEDAVPETVSYTTMKKGRDLMRIRVNLAMVFATVLGAVGVISYAKRKQGSGDSLQKRSLDWESSMKDKGQKEAAEREAKLQGTR